MSPCQRRIPAHLEDLVVPPDVSTTAPLCPLSGTSPVAASSPPIPSRSTCENDSAHNQEFFERLVQSTPARIGTGRTGTRYRTDTYLALRGDHAIAKDAVSAEVLDDLASELGCIEVATRCPNREYYLLHPNDGRRLSEESERTVTRDGDHNMDVQVIMADGLSASALQVNGPRLLPALIESLGNVNLSTGRPILARMARVGLQDHIGVLLGCQATVICLGERPGLGTGDSLSIYLAINPKLDQDNAEKNCISNIRPPGLSPESAAKMAAKLLHRGLELGRGGLDLA